MEQDGPDTRLDWSSLPWDPTALILGKLELPDLLASAAACRSWRAAYKADPRIDAGPFFRGPCLVFHSGAPASEVTLRSLTDGAGGGVHRVTLPDPPFATRYVMGSSHGWLATADEKSDLLLVNPVTRAQVRLPPICTLRHVTCSFRRGILRRYRVRRVDLGESVRRRHVRKYPIFENLKPDEGRLSFYEKIAWSSDPTSGNCIVMIMQSFQRIISFARVGDARWNLLHANRSCRSYHDFFYNGEDGLFYGIRGNGEVHTIDFNGLFPVANVVFRATVPPPAEDAKYIVRAPWGEILQISWDDEYVWDPDVNTSSIVVYKMDFVEQRIIEARNLQGYALFMGFNSSFFFLPNEDCTMIKQNHVYHAADLIDNDYRNNIYAPRRMIEINLEDGRINDVWPSPNTWSNWPPPVWLMPSFSPRT
jgi:hypothetical protein